MYLDELIKAHGKDASAVQVSALLTNAIYQLQSVAGLISQGGTDKLTITLGDIRERIDVEKAKRVLPVQTT